MNGCECELNPRITNADFLAGLKQCGIPYTINVRNDRVYSLGLSNAICKTENYSEGDSENICTAIECNCDKLNIHTIFGTESIEFYKVANVEFHNNGKTIYIFERGMLKPWMTIEIRKK